MSGVHGCSHVAPLSGVPFVFASVDYPRDDPPDRLTLDGETFVRNRTVPAVRHDVGGGIGHLSCGGCGWTVERADRYCRHCGAVLCHDGD